MKPRKSQGNGSNSMKERKPFYESKEKAPAKGMPSKSDLRKKNQK